MTILHTPQVPKTDLNRFPEKAEKGELLLFGADGSPYSNKILAILRFRRLPHRWLGMQSPEAVGTANPPGPPLAPKLLFPDGKVMNDSTFLIKELEQRYSGRSVVPTCPALSFLVALFEDFCDEWLTKAMFHYRWTYDIETAGFGIGAGGLTFAAGIDRIRDLGAQFGARQVARLRDVVGSNEVTGPVIESSFKRFLQVLEQHLHVGHGFLFGSRPSAADFALFGQLHPMITLDPETSRHVFAASRSVWFWYHSLKDLSGQSLANEQAGWMDVAQLPQTLQALFVEIGRFYAPFMVANAAAVAAGAKKVECILDGSVPWQQAPFKYQAKCLKWLQEHYNSLDDGNRQAVNKVLAGSGCLTMLTPGSKL